MAPPSLFPELVRAGRLALEAGSVTPQIARAEGHESLLTEYALRHGMLAWTPGASHDARFEHARRSMVLVRALLEAADALQEAGVPFAAFKGPVLSQWLYGDPCARRFQDLDLLVASSRMQDALGVLARLGYRSSTRVDARDIRYRWIGAYQVGRDDGASLDLHWRLAGPRFGTVVDTSRLLDEAMTVTVGGRRLPAPRSEHTAAIVIFHAAKHLWYCLEYPFALAAMIRFARVDWAEVLRLLRSSGWINAAATGFALVESLFEVATPEVLRPALRRNTLPRLHRAAMQALLLPPDEFPDKTIDRRIQRWSRDRATDRIRYDLLRVFEPTQADCEWVTLPARLAPLYWLVRPWRLTGRVMSQWRSAPH